MSLRPKDTLTDQEVQSGLKLIIKDGLASQTMVTLTGGAFLIALALKLGASNFVIGLLAAIPSLVQFLQVPSVYLVEKIRNRKAITLFAAGGARAFWLLIALIPIVFAAEAGLTVLVVAIALHSAVGAAAGPSYGSWMRDLIPQDRLGAFYSKLSSYLIPVSIALSMGVAFFIDKWKEGFPDYEVHGYSILFFLGFCAGLVGLYFMARIPEPRMAAPKEKRSFFRQLIQPFRDKNFRNLITFSGSWSFAVSLAGPFFIVYMLKRLGLSMTFVIGLSVLSQLGNLAFMRIWGAFTDRYSNKSVLLFSGPLFVLCILGWTFTTMPEKHFLTIPLLIAIHILMGVFGAGVGLASGNIGMKLAPRDQAASYLTARSLVNSLLASAGPILGGKFIDIFEARELSLVLNWTSPAAVRVFHTVNLKGWDFFFVFAFIIGLYSMHRLVMVKEAGEVEEKVVMNEFITEVSKTMRNFSSIEAMRYMVSMSFSVFGVEKPKEEEVESDA